MKKDRSDSIHQRNLQILVTETYKVRIDLGGEIIMRDIFHFTQKPYKVRNHSTLKR